ncbi:hypothetical protein IBT49_04820 [Erwinia sp. S63]|uniref:hypothetical protein n=1 Tax=Erwinia sp. S63 TaxID=2769341 RepID=UPI00190C3D43|nr:hypothetical protein [Erwinia sp. S63]MBK0095286.1 hypothetical protein [Erwinia sp. S63]
MSVYRDENGKYRTYADNTQEFDYADAAYRHERDLQAALHPQTDHASGGGGAGGIDVSWDEFKTLIAFIGPVLVLYWLVAFPALNASWLLMNTPAPFSWIGSLLYTAWDLAVKVAGAPYYLAYFFGTTGVYFAMPIIAFIWLFVLSSIINRLRSAYPKLMRKSFYFLAMAAAVPVVLVLIAYLFGSLRGDSIAYFWYGHDPYTSHIWAYAHSGSSRLLF